MRAKCTLRTSMFEYYAEHEIGQELKMMSEWLDTQLDLLDWVEADVNGRSVEETTTGRKGLSIESVLRCAILKQYRQLTYDDLVFCLMDSASCQTFARLSSEWSPKKTTLQSAISVISDVTWEQINKRLLQCANETKVERGEMLRIDSTVTDSPIHDPSDSTLLWDCVRVMIRWLQKAEEIAGDKVIIEYSNHQRVAKKRMRSIFYTKGDEKKKSLYKDLISVTNKTLEYVSNARVKLQMIKGHQAVARDAWNQDVARYEPLILKVIGQTERRIFQGEKVPAAEKIFSIFEEHTDIIIKGSREIQYGHKLNLSTGRSGLVLDVVIEEGNPADSDRLLPMLDRHIENYGKAPRQMAADGGYASIENLHEAKALNVEDVAFHKKRGLKVEEMTKSPWVYRKLRNFRAGIEAGISCLKRGYGLDRCTWKGLQHFKSYVWSSVVAHNLALFGRLLAT